MPGSKTEAKRQRVRELLEERARLLEQCGAMRKDYEFVAARMGISTTAAAVLMWKGAEAGPRGSMRVALYTRGPKRTSRPSGINEGSCWSEGARLDAPRRILGRDLRGEGRAAGTRRAGRGGEAEEV